mmetsp:Transcript_32794/g.60982  ORF Transcript_32794/g.60982 Transcript_32794/m.60982 type:complete len:261 (-) Transcript_32794:7-789(-)
MSASTAGRKAATGPAYQTECFFCIDCCAKHRAFNQNVSFIKHSKLDSWSENQLCTMLAGGNNRAKDCLALSAKTALERDLGGIYMLFPLVIEAMKDPSGEASETYTSSSMNFNRACLKERANLKATRSELHRLLLFESDVKSVNPEAKNDFSSPTSKSKYAIPASVRPLSSSLQMKAARKLSRIRSAAYQRKADDNEEADEAAWFKITELGDYAVLPPGDCSSGSGERRRRNARAKSWRGGCKPTSRALLSLSFGRRRRL